jgi:uncharacterized membrane protein
VTNRPSGAGILAAVPASALLGVLLLVVGPGLLAVGLLGWQRRLPRNRFAGIRTPATLRSEAAFSAANRVAAPPVLAAGAVCTAGGALALGTGGAALVVIVGVTAAGTVGLLLAGGLLGHRVAAAMPPPRASCAGCTCTGGTCSTT